MSLTLREFWTAAHGMIFGAVFLLEPEPGRLAHLWHGVEGARGLVCTHSSYGCFLHRLEVRPSTGRE